MQWWCVVAKVFADLIAVWRSLRARPLVACLSMSVLALGIGLVAAMFALADPFLRPLPYAAPHELVLITLEEKREADAVNTRPDAAQAPTLAEWAARRDLFCRIAAFRLFRRPIQLRVREAGFALDMMEVSEGFFDVLGIRVPSIPMAPVDSDGSVRRLVVTTGAIERVFTGTDPVGHIFGGPDGATVLVEGILPRDFLFPWPGATRRVDAVSTVRVGRLFDVKGFERSFVVIARLRPGITTAATRAALSAGLSPSSHVRIDVQPLSASVTRRVRPLALGALFASALVLLACIANISNLLLARNVYRAREFATRLALGASRLDLARLILLDLGLQSAGGVVGGLLLANVALRLCGTVIPLQYSALGDPQLTTRAVLIGCLAGACVMLAALIPTLAAWSVTMQALGGGRAVSEGRKIRVLRCSMAASQTAAATVLFVGAALLVRSYINLMSQDTGFSGHVIVAPAIYPAGYSPPRLLAEIEGTIARLRRIGVVEQAGAVVGPMLNGSRSGAIMAAGGRNISVALKWVTPSYFAVVGDHVRSGRAFNADRAIGAAVVNESLARRAWPAGSAVGQLLGVSGSPWQVVGVVRDTFDVSLDQLPEPTAFFLLNEMPSGIPFVTYVARVRARSSNPGGAVRDAVSHADRDAVVTGTASIDERLAESIRDRSFATLVLGFFAVSGLGVSVAGIAGLVAFIVARRTREIAICVALGATHRDVLRLAVGEAAAAALAGTVAGLLIGHWLSAILESLVYGIRVEDWLGVAAVSLAMVAVSLMSAAIPARRALRLSPTTALRVD